MGYSKHERANSNADCCNFDLWQGEKDRKKHKRLTLFPFSSTDNLIGAFQYAFRQLRRNHPTFRKNGVKHLTLILNNLEHCCELSRIKYGTIGLKSGYPSAKVPSFVRDTTAGKQDK